MNEKSIEEIRQIIEDDKAGKANNGWVQFDPTPPQMDKPSLYRYGEKTNDRTWVSPYFDDYNETKTFGKFLYEPSKSLINNPDHGEAMKQKSDGGSSSYYELPYETKELQDLIEHRKMNFAIGNIFKACYRLGAKSGIDDLYDIKKIIWYAEREKARIEKELNNEQS